MVFRRSLCLAWLALTLNALAPALAYAHIHIGAHGEVIEHCAADEPDEPGDADAQDQHSHSSKGTVPHCQYCAGFAAGVSLAFGDSVGILHAQVAARPVRSVHAVLSGRSSVRIAQQRAPPVSS